MSAVRRWFEGRRGFVESRCDVNPTGPDGLVRKHTDVNVVQDQSKEFLQFKVSRRFVSAPVFPK